MPIYEYQCSVCGHKFDELQKIDAAPLKICPKCHKRTLKKLISASNFHLKGSGWYKTDYKKKDQTGSEKPVTDTKDKK